MSLNQSFIPEFEQESKSTRKILERVPVEKPDWKPHKKSTALGYLAVHVAELHGWPDGVLSSDELDFAKIDYKPRVASSTSELMSIFEENYSKGLGAIKNATDEMLMSNWTMRNGEKVFFSAPRIAVIRSCMNHIVHHRAQLGVYLRLLNVPLPSIYGPSADEQM